MTTVAPAISDQELLARYLAGDPGALDIAAELDRASARRKSAARGRSRHSGWHDAAYANYLAAEAYARGNLLSEAGKRRGRDPWPMLWEGSEDAARKLASEELQRFWDYVTPRPPGPRAFAAGMREREEEPSIAAKEPRVSAADLAAQAARGIQPPEPAPAAEPGQIAHMITALGAFTRATHQAAGAIAAAGRIGT